MINHGLTIGHKLPIKADVKHINAQKIIQTIVGVRLSVAVWDPKRPVIMQSMNKNTDRSFMDVINKRYGSPCPVNWISSRYLFLVVWEGFLL